MDTVKTLRGSMHLAFDVTESVTHIVEGMHRNIAAASSPFGNEPEGGAPGIAGLVYRTVRGVNRAVRRASDGTLGVVSPALGDRWPPGPYREAVIAALNGVCGDHLEQSANPLAISMHFRVFLPAEDAGGLSTGPGDDAAVERAAVGRPFGNLLELDRRPVELYPRTIAFGEADFHPTGRLLVMAHGLSMNDREWTSQGHSHALELAAVGGYTPVYLVYNSGRHISTNGQELSAQLDALLDAWPVPVESITMVGFSMGGLVARSAMHTAQEQGRNWLAKVDRAVYIGSPHHGAVMERGGYWLQKGVAFSPYTAPLSALGRARSSGIIDLRHGNVQEADWHQVDAHEEHRDCRVGTPLVEGVEHYAIAATLSKRSGDPLGRLLGDGLVHPSSATGRHADSRLQLDIPQDNFRILYEVGHLGLLSDPRVTNLLLQWLCPDLHTQPLSYA